MKVLKGFLILAVFFWGLVPPGGLFAGQSDSVTLKVKVINSPALITGKVTESDGTTPVPAGTWVSIWTQGKVWQGEEYRLGHTTTNADGSYQLFFGGNSGLYDFDAGTYGYITQIIPNIQVTKGQITNLDFRLEKSAGIQGKVTKSDGNPAPQGTRISVFTKDHYGEVAYLITYSLTQADGTYILYWNLPEGSYDIGSGERGYIEDKKLNQFLKAGQLTTINFTLGISAGFKGKVTDQNGNALYGAYVFAKQNGNLITQGVTQTDGTYLVYYNLPTGTYDIEAQYPGYPPQVKRNIQLTAGQVLSDLNFIMAPDTTPPTGLIIINNNAQYTNSIQVTLTLSATDDFSGVDKMTFSHNGVNWSQREDYSITKTWELFPGDGQKYVFVKFRDKAGNWSQAYSDTIFLLTTNALITGKVTALDGITPVPEGTWVSIWTAGHVWEESHRLKYATTRADGSYQLFFDGASGLYDFDAGAFGYINLIQRNIQVTKGQITNLDFKLEKSAGIQGKVFKQDGSLASGVSILVWRKDGVNITYTLTKDDGTYLLYWNIPAGTYDIEAYHATYGRDIKYNISLTAGQITTLDFTIGTDSTPPTGTITINNDNQYTNSTSVILNLSAKDNTGGSGVSEMQFSNDGTTYSTAEAYATTKAWTLTSGDGSKTVYVKFSDKVGNWSQAYSDTIILDTTPPAIQIISPEDGDEVAGSQ